MRIIPLILICVILVAVPVYAVKVQLFVEFPDYLESSCYDMPAGATAKDVLDVSRYNVTYKYNGNFLNSINNYTCRKNQCWFFYYSMPKSDKLIFSNFGIKQLNLKNNTIIYFGYYQYGSNFMPLKKPKKVRFLCNKAIKAEKEGRDNTFLNIGIALGAVAILFIIMRSVKWNKS